MNTSIIVGSIALALAGVLATGQAFGETSRPESRQVLQQQIEKREAQRQVAVTEHEKRKAEYTRDCTRQGLSAPQLEACRAAYLKL